MNFNNNQSFGFGSVNPQGNWNGSSSIFQFKPSQATATGFGCSSTNNSALFGNAPTLGNSSYGQTTNYAGFGNTAISNNQNNGFEAEEIQLRNFYFFNYF